MKTIQKIKELIRKESAVGDCISDAERRTANKNLILLRACLVYLESGPREEFIRKEINRLQIKLDIINNGFVMPFKTENDRIFQKLKREYLKEHNFSLLKEQLSTLKFILN